MFSCSSRRRSSALKTLLLGDGYMAIQMRCFSNAEFLVGVLSALSKCKQVDFLAEYDPRMRRSSGSQ